MKKLVVTIFVLLSNIVLSQNTQFKIEIDWKFGNYATTDHNYSIPFFDAQNFLWDDHLKQVYYQSSLLVNQHIDIKSVQVSDLKYDLVSEAQLGEIDLKNIPEKFEIRVETTDAREDIYRMTILNAFFKENNQIYRVSSLSVNYNATNQKLFETQSDYSTISNSVLSSGDWFRFYVESTGVYKISKSFLNSLGFNTNLDPRGIKIFGHGGGNLPLSNSANFPVDPQQIAFEFVGESNGVFNDDDYILVYLVGPDQWSQDNLTHLNLYSDKIYYYITHSATQGKRIGNYVEPTEPTTDVTNTFDGYHFHEKDLFNIGRIGRRWFGEQFGIQNSYNFSFNIPNIDTSQPIQATAVFASAAANTSSMTISNNGQNISNVNISGKGNGVTPYYNLTTHNFTINPQAEVNLVFNYSNAGIPNARVFLDYIILRSQRFLTSSNSHYRIRSSFLETGTGVVDFQFNNAQSVRSVWDISDIYNITTKNNNGSSNFNVRAVRGANKSFIALHPTNFLTPQSEQNARVPNQNLKGTIFNNAQNTFQDIDYLIITPAFLRTEAQRLANFHRNTNQLNVKVVDLDQIYREFSTGRQDISAIRNFVRYVYNNASSSQNRVKYLNIFGDASFDFKERIPANINTNIVPIYHALIGSTTGISSFSSDDFYGFMGPNEGNLDQIFPSGLDIAVGRMLVSNIIQAKEMVNKVIEYHDQNSFGRWRNNLVMVSDDADKTADASLQVRMDQAAEIIKSEKPFFNINKIYLDAYQQQSTAGGQRYPQARQDFKNAFENGTLVINYLGHGGEDGLASERVYETVDAQNFSNKFKYPLFITLTCEFSRFDNPFRPTAGEYTYRNPKGGAIAMITTTREIGQFTAEQANFVLNQYLFDYGVSPNLGSMAESLMRTKNNYGNSSLRVISFIGCPATKLAIPKPIVVLTKINDEPIESTTTVLQALSTITMNGEVRDVSNSQVLQNYNGSVAVQVFDKNQVSVTLNNDGNASPMNFNVLGHTIFRGNATVTNGLFEFTFVVPKNIKINVDNGKVSFYAKSVSPVLQNQTGYNTDILVGGVNPNAPLDNTPPIANLYMNDKTFVNGGLTDENPIFLAYLEDENGINTIGGIGHDIVGVLDGDESKPYIMNDFYETKQDDFTRGVVRFPFRNLEEGLHNLKFTAWDVYNNPVTAEIDFVVSKGDNISLTNVLNYPNPFVNYTQFWFNHNRPFEPLEVQVQIFTITGKVVKTINQTVLTDGFLSRDISWDGRDDFGDKIGKGVYIYRLKVKSTLSNQITEKIEKLVIL